MSFSLKTTVICPEIGTIKIILKIKALLFVFDIRMKMSIARKLKRIHKGGICRL